MNRLYRRLLIAACTAALALPFVGSSAHGSVIVTATETNGDVVFSGGGTLDLSNLNFLTPIAGLGSGAIQAAAPGFGTLIGDGGDAFGGGITGPDGFGTGTFTLASSGSGDSFGLIDIGILAVVVPVGYDGGQLDGSMTFAGSTFASLGLEEGTYVWSWDAQSPNFAPSTGTSFTLIIGNNGVIPEPTSLMIFGGIAGIGLMVRRRNG